MKGYIWIHTDIEKCNLIGPYECPFCAAKVMLDGEMEDMFFTLCPHCGYEVEFEKPVDD